MVEVFYLTCLFKIFNKKELFSIMQQKHYKVNMISASPRSGMANRV